LLKALWLTQKIQKWIFDIVLRIQNQQKSQRTLSIMASYKVNIPAGPLWSNDEAQQVGPRIAAAHQGNFTGQWTTVVESAMSVVEVELQVENTGTHEFKTNVLAGPLWSNDEAQKLGPQIAASYGAEFTGQWQTIVEGVMSVIEIKYTF